MSQVVSWVTDFVQENKQPLLCALGVGLLWYVRDIWYQRGVILDLSITTDVSVDLEYDFVIVGGGSAGCLLASRLADAHLNVKDEDGKPAKPFRVLLLDKNVPEVKDTQDPFLQWVLLQSHSRYPSLPVGSLAGRKVVMQAGKR